MLVVHFKRYIYLLLFLLVTLLPTACEIEQPVPPLTREERTKIDSIFRAEDKVLKKEMDSLCDVRFNSFVDHAVDSIIKERLLEIEQLINRE